MISIIIAAYNVERQIAACIESIFAQTWKDFELIVVDDGSADSTPERVQSAIAGHSNALCLRQANAGAGAARNAGIDAAKGEFIMFVDGDDLLEPEIVERLMEQMDDGIDIACCACAAFNDERGEEFRCHFFPESFVARSDAERERLYLQLLDLRAFQRVSKRCGIGVPWGKLYRAELLRRENLRFPALRRMQDNIFNMYAFDRARGIAYLDEPLYRYRLDHTAGVNLSADARCAVIEAREAFFSAHPKRLTPAVREAFYLERMRYLGNSLTVAAAQPKARAEVKGICEREAYRRFLSEPMLKGVPGRYRVMIRLAKLGLYGALGLICRAGGKK